MEIVSIILRLKNQEIKVTVDEAKELLGQLTAVFGGEKPIIQKEYVPYGIPYPVQPQYPWWTRPWWDNQPYLVFSDGHRGEITWQGSTCNVVCDGTTLWSTSFTDDGSASSSWTDKDGKSFLGSSSSSSWSGAIEGGQAHSNIQF